MNRSRLYPAAAMTCLLVLGLLSVGSAPPKADDAKDQAAEKLFDADPAHPWNRLHRLFYVRDMSKGRNYTYHGLEAPFGSHGKILLEEPLYTRTVEALDAFLRAKDDERIKDPLKRALLQHDLWYIFDTLAEASWSFGFDHEYHWQKQPQRRALEKRLAQVMRRLEQPAKQLAALPDNYARAIKSKAFPATFDPKRPEQPYLPASLPIDGQGDWVPISRWHSNGSTLAAPRHHQELTQGRAVFLALLRLPGGRKPTEAYLARMPSFDERRLEKFPPLPDGSQVAFVRRMLLMDDRGRLQATPVTESVQLRAFPKGDKQRFFEFTLDRAAFLSERGGLHAVSAAEKEYFGFGIEGSEDEPFGKGPRRKPVVILSNCVHCHIVPNRPASTPLNAVFSINTFGFQDHEWYHGAAQTNLAAQIRRTVDRKIHSYSWGLLQGLRESMP